MSQLQFTSILLSILLVGLHAYPNEEMRKDEVKNRIVSSARFWGKRSEADPSDIRMKLAKSNRFWGKRSSEPEQIIEDSMDYSSEPYFRDIKGSLPSKLTLSSRFWGRR